MAIRWYTPKYLAAGPSKGQISATCVATVASSPVTIVPTVRMKGEVARLEELDLRRASTIAESPDTSCETADDHCGRMASRMECKDGIKGGSISSVEEEEEVSITAEIGSKGSSHVS